MKKNIMLYTLLSVFVFTIFSYAADDSDIIVSVNLKELPSNVASEILKYKKETVSKASTIDVDDVERYTEIGRAIALSLKEVCTVLSVEVNSFVTTPVGKITTALIIYRVAGKDIIRSVILAFFAMFLYTTILTSFIYFFKTKKTIAKITKDEGKEKVTEETIEYVPRYNFKGNESRVACAICHVISFVIVTAVILTNIC